MTAAPRGNGGGASGAEGAEGHARGGHGPPPAAADVVAAPPVGHTTPRGRAAEAEAAADAARRWRAEGGAEVTEAFLAYELSSLLHEEEVRGEEEEL